MDLCNEKLGTKVASSQVNSDGYEVENLIAADPSKRRKGFLVERFIKPPVDITFTFPCSVELNCIVLFTAVNSQKSVGIDMFGLSSRGDKLDEHPLGKCYLKSGNKVCFVNTRFRSRPHFPEGIAACDCKDAVVRNIAGSLSCFTGIKVRIWRTESGSLVAMGHVSIHGVPARSVAAHIVARLLEVVNPKYAETRGKGARDKKKHEKSRVKNAESSLNSAKLCSRGADLKRSNGEASTFSKEPMKNCEKQTNSSDKLHGKFCNSTQELPAKNRWISDGKIRPKNGAKDEVPVPEEFLDGLTFEIMTFPILLPSGNTIDKTTLEKHVSAEGEWGRAPNDPFTGLIFSTGKQPVPNVQLKTRIDRFFLQNEQLAQGRTTGKRKFTESAAVEDVTGSGVKTKLCTTEYATGMSPHFSEGKTSFKNLEVRESDLPASSIEMPSSHEMRLSQSLDLALGSLTSYTTTGATVSRWQHLYEPPKVCCQCNADSSTAIMYSLPCSHLLCRRCAIPSEKSQANPSKCVCCGEIYGNSMLSRVHQ